MKKLKMAVLVLPAVGALFVRAAVAQNSQANTPTGQPSMTNPVDQSTTGLPAGATPPSKKGAQVLCNFPPTAARNLESGSVELTYKIGTDGNVKQIEVTRPSLQTGMDSAAIACLESWTYNPAMLNGQPIEVTWHTTITFNSGKPPTDVKNLVNGPRLIFLGSCEGWHSFLDHKDVLLGFKIGAEGNVSDARILQSSGDKSIDADALDCIGKRRYKPATNAAGEPVEIQTTSWMY